jgi:hypothetical protein
MANSKDKCKECKNWFRPATMIITPNGKFCTHPCLFKWISEQREKTYRRKLAKERAKARRDEKAARSAHTKRRKAVRRRTDWYQILQDLVNQWVLYRDRGKGCVTCRTQKDKKFDAGHFLSVGAHKDTRFDPLNIHGQCSVNCNQYGRGMPKEYEAWMIEEYGQETVDWLKSPDYPTLKEQFPTIEDIQAECKRYRQALTRAGIKPRR